MGFPSRSSFPRRSCSGIGLHSSIQRWIVRCTIGCEQPTTSAICCWSEGLSSSKARQSSSTPLPRGCGGETFAFCDTFTRSGAGHVRACSWQFRACVRGGGGVPADLGVGSEKRARTRPCWAHPASFFSRKKCWKRLGSQGRPGDFFKKPFFKKTSFIQNSANHNTMCAKKVKTKRTVALEIN